eukprot:COSAG01_NODE_1301_length_10829_cov_20.185182_13_plen_208_part_00
MKRSIDDVARTVASRARQPPRWRPQPAPRAPLPWPAAPAPPRTHPPRPPEQRHARSSGTPQRSAAGMAPAPAPLGGRRRRRRRVRASGAWWLGWRTMACCLACAKAASTRSPSCAARAAAAAEASASAASASALSAHARTHARNHASPTQPESQLGWPANFPLPRTTCSRAASARRPLSERVRSACVCVRARRGAQCLAQARVLPPE